MIQDPRIDRLESMIDRIQEQINALHSGSMQVVTTAFTEMERRLTEKMDGQTLKLAADLSKLREGMVPLSEHAQLMNRVDQLWNRDLGARVEWEEMRAQIPVLWETHTQTKGVKQAYRYWLGALSIVVAILTAFTLLYNLGLRISVRP